MDTIHRQILEDAINTAIESERKNIKYERFIKMLLLSIPFMLIFAFLLGGVVCG